MTPDQYTELIQYCEYKRKILTFRKENDLAISPDEEMFSWGTLMDKLVWLKDKEINPQ